MFQAAGAGGRSRKWRAHQRRSGQGVGLAQGSHARGPRPALTFTAGKPHPVDCWYYAVLKQGKFTTPYGLKDFCAAK